MRKKKCWTQENVISTQNAALRLPLIKQTWKPKTVNVFYSPLTEIKDIHVSTIKLELQFGKKKKTSQLKYFNCIYIILELKN